MLLFREESSSNQRELFLNIGQPKKQQVKNRWDKRKDIEAFRLINELIKSTSLDFKILKLGRGKMHPELKSILTTVKDQVGWRGSIYELRTRVSAILKNNKFTARDLRKAKKYAKKYRKGEISQKELLENFPGKSLSEILA